MKNLKLNKIFDYFLLLSLVTMISTILITWITLPKIAIIDNRVNVYGPIKTDYLKAHELLRKSPIKSTKLVNVFIVPRWVMVLVNPFSGFNAQGFNLPIINFIYINQEAQNESARTIEGLIAHEVTHTDLQQQFGLKTIFADTWKMEGICDYVSQESSIAPHEQEKVIVKYTKHDNLNGKEEYLIYKKQVEKLINQGMGFKDIVEKDIEAPTI